MRDANRAMLGAPDPEQAQRRALEVYRGSPEVEFAEVEGSGSLRVKFVGGQQVETIFLQVQQAMIGFPDVAEREARKLELHRSMVDLFRSVVDSGGIVAFGHGYRIEQHRADSLQALIARVKGGDAPPLSGELSANVERFIAELRQPPALTEAEFSPSP